MDTVVHLLIIIIYGHSVQAMASPATLLVTGVKSRVNGKKINHHDLTFDWTMRTLRAFIALAEAVKSETVSGRLAFPRNGFFPTIK